MPLILRKLFMCPLGLCGMLPCADETHLWGECLRCGKRAGLVSRASVRAFAEAEARHRQFQERQAATMASKPPAAGEGDGP